MAEAGSTATLTNGNTSAATIASAAALFAGPGEVRALARTLDWGATPLGWPHSWSPALRITTRALLDAPHPLCLWAGPEYALIYNDAYRRILAAKHPASLGQPGSLVWAEIWEGLAAQFDQVSQGGPPVFGEDARFVMARLEGGATEVAWFTYSLSALREEDGRIVAVLNISPETTGRVRAEQALEVERTRLRSVVVQAPVPMALHEGPEHRYVLVNAAYRRVSGGRDVTGLTLREAFPEIAGQGIYEVFDHVFATGEPWTGPETHLHYDRLGNGKEDAWFDLRYDPVRDPDGRVTGILNFSVDVTDQVRARREVERLLAESEEARREAESANKAKTDFLAVMSHELRTPLNAIGGYAQLMELGLQGPVTPEQLAALGRIQRGQQHLLGLINSVLNYAKLEAGHVIYEDDDVSVANVLTEVWSLVGPQARAKGLVLVVVPDDRESLDRADVVARADHEKVRQVLLNLLSNAIKFTGAGGTVTMGYGSTPDGRVAITVADSGRGIHANQQVRVFEPFVQVDQRLTRAEDGTGLGLAISRELARGMGGDLTVESTPGVGSTFLLTLPRALK